MRLGDPRFESGVGLIDMKCLRKALYLLVS